MAVIPHTPFVPLGARTRIRGGKDYVHLLLRCQEGPCGSCVDGKDLDRKRPGVENLLGGGRDVWIWSGHKSG